MNLRMHSHVRGAANIEQHELRERFVPFGKIAMKGIMPDLVTADHLHCLLYTSRCV